MSNAPIGIFDSGIGGLTVARKIMDELPNESIVYIGDTARVPYGTRSSKIVCEFASDLVSFLLKKKVKLLVVACNTISAHCLPQIKSISNVPVIGVIDSTIESAISSTKNKSIGIIGTPATVRSKIYERKINKVDSTIKIYQASCPLFVPLAENGFEHHKAAKLIAHDYLEKLTDKKIDTLILGCTHYPILSKTIKSVVGNNVTIIDSSIPTSQEVKSILISSNLLTSSKSAKKLFYVTDNPKLSQKVAARFMNQEIKLKLAKL